MKPENWVTNSQKALYDAIYSVEHLLRQKIHANAPEDNNSPLNRPFIIDKSAPEYNSQPSALNKLCEDFELSKFERQTLVLVAGAELDLNIRRLCAKAHKNDDLYHPTLDLAIDLFSNDDELEPFYMSENGSLRNWQLLKFVSTGQGRQFNPLGIEERILDYLLGFSKIDTRLKNYVFPLTSSSSFPQDAKLVNDISIGIARAFETAIATRGKAPLVQLCGSSFNLKQQIVTTALEPLELPLYEMPWILMSSSSMVLDKFYWLWTREVMLEDCVLLINCESLSKKDTKQLGALYKFLTSIDSPIIICASELLPLSGRSALNYEIPDLEQSEQRQLWHNYLGEHAEVMTPEIESIVANFQMTPQEIYSTAKSSLTIASSYEDLSKKIWTTCRDRARPKLDELASRIEPSAGWSDLILPNDRKEMLGEMIAQVRHRTQVFEKWKFKKKNNRGLGLCALFAGTSGTGKTMAAEVLAMELKLDLYRIDLSTVVSKYIGETEKNLGKLFDAAQSGGVILLFDEGDALFGKRTEAGDSKDRYANMEVSYLLQRIESYNGLAIVTTNIEDSLDSAFLRRLRYIIKFPFPGPSERAAIWKRVYPEGVLKEPHPRVYQMLGQMEISGGLIYSIALKSAFIAADDRKADGVYLPHIYQAAKSEYTKIGRVLSVSETPWIRSA